jgi:asparagine synthase (glutamine-hydrolysing)
MCGIAGVLHFDTQHTVNTHNLLRMRDMLEHRGPNSAGCFVDGNLGLAFRRLSILDLSDAGNQPMKSEDGRYTIVFNGEIYNYREFYPELKARNIQFKSTSDTEVLLHLYRLHGADMLPRLNGMFAFAIWDNRERSLFLARDRMGVKPLYYTFSNRALYFASEPKAIFAAQVEPIVAQANIFEYLSCRFIGGEETLFSGIKRLLPGYCATITQEGSTHFSQWWNLADSIKAQQQIDNPIDWFSKSFDQSVARRMISDVPVGVLLSGGLDSGSIVASLKHQGYTDVESFTIGFSKQEHDETKMAERLAKSCGYGFNPLTVEEDKLHEHFVRATWYCDEPLVHLNEPHLLAIAQFAKQKVSVLLSGEGADEMLGGYVRYKPLKYHNWLKQIGLLVDLGLLRGERWRKLQRYSALDSPSALLMYNASNFFPAEVKSVYNIDETPAMQYRHSVLQEAQALYPGDTQRQALFFDQKLYLCSLLDRNDRTTMGASIECREPFLDPRLLTGAGSLPSKFLFSGKKGKYILCQAMMQRLPKETLNFKKIGFSVPWGHYLRTNPYFAHEVAEMQRSDMFSYQFLEHINPGQLVYQFNRGSNAVLPFILPLLSLFVWHKYYRGILRAEMAAIDARHEHSHTS